MPKIVMMGAGSMVFTKRLIGDILSFPELSESTISLVDIDKRRLDLITQLAKKMARQEGGKVRIESTTNRKEILGGADYVIITIAVGGLNAYLSDIQIPEILLAREEYFEACVLFLCFWISAKIWKKFVLMPC